MATALAIGSSIMGMGSQLIGASKQKKAEKKQALIEQYQMQSQIRQGEQNVKNIGADIGALTSDRDYNTGILQREQTRFGQGQRATLGASGANVNTASPLSTMEETALLQERDRKQMGANYGAQLSKLESEKAFQEGELAEGKSLYEKLYAKKRKPVTPLDPKKPLVNPIYGGRGGGAR